MKSNHRFQRAGHNPRFLLGTLLVLTGFLSVQAGTFKSDFATDPGGTSIANKSDTVLVKDGILKLVDLTDLIDPSTGQYDEHRLPLQGCYILPAIDAGKKVASFTATFKARVGGGTESSALGFSLVLANDYDSGTPFREGGGNTTGLTISFIQAFGQGGIGEGTDPSDPPGIVIKQKGQKVIAKRFTGIRTDGPGSGHAPVFVPVEVKLTEDGLLSITYNSNKVYDNVAIGYIPIEGQFGFGAGIENQTAIVRDNFWIDDLSITTTTVTGASVVSVDPPTQNASPDATIKIGIQGLGTGAVQLDIDGKTVTASKTDAGGGVTTITYSSATLFDSGSSHTVKLTYAGKVYQYGFTVATAPIIPPTAAAATGSVDPSKTGFKVRVYQVEAGQPNNDADRAERELAGDLGPNTIDKAGANADGTFDKDLINFSYDGNAAGDIDGDGLIPGIPGSATNPTDNIAMEVIGFLDLKPGAYSIGAVSDDSLKVTIGSEARDATATKLLEISGGRATGPFIIQQAGIYPFRALWTQGTGPASLELWSQDASGNKILLNDKAKASSIKSYRQRAAGVQVLPYLTRAKPAPGDVNISTLPAIELALADDSTTVDQKSIKVSVNGTAVDIPSGAITKSGKVTTIKLTPAQQLQPNTLQKLKIDFADSAGKSLSREYTFTTGKGGGGNLLNAVKGYWTFDKGNLKAKIGHDLEYVDASVAKLYQFGVTGKGDFASIPPINGKTVGVIKVPYVSTDDYKKLGLRLQHNIAPNGGGKKVNQFTIILDILWGDGSGYGALWQLHDLDNPGDSDMYWQAGNGSYGKACCSAYVAPNAHQDRFQWARVAFAVDLAANPPVLAKYINGIKNLQDIGGNRGHVDSEFALSVPAIVLFGDSDNENSDAYLSAVQVREGRMSDEEVAALGGPDAAGIPLPYSQWNFKDAANPLAATVGSDIQFVDSSVANLYKVGVTGQGDFAAIPPINGKSATVYKVPYVTTDDYKKLGLRLRHGLAANGGGKKVNQYTVIMDILWGEGSGYGAVWQLHDLDNPGDSDMYWQAGNGSYGKACCSAYVAPNAHQDRSQWARVAFAVDLAANPPVLAKYINGIKNLQDIGGNRGHVDSEFAFSVPEIVLFGDSDNENSDAYLSSLQVRTGRMSDEEIAALGGPDATGIPTPDPVKGEWNFKDAAKPLKATAGADLEFVDPKLASLYKVGVTGKGDFATVPLINGKATTVFKVPYVTTDDYKKLGLRVTHGIAPNGGGKKVNQFTAIMDILWGDGSGYGAVWQLHDLDNPGDSDMYWQAGNGSYGKACCSAYVAPNAHQDRFQWARVAFAVDLAANPPVLAKYINGIKNLQDIGGNRGHVDSEFALSVPAIVLFGDSDNENSDAYLSAFQVREGRMSDEEIVALGGPDAGGIPAASIGAARSVVIVVPPPKLNFSRSGKNLTLSWDSSASGFVLESTPALVKPTWTAVSGVANNSATIQIGTDTKFYRLRK